MGRIGVLTYNVPHRKTQDLLFRLRGKGYKFFSTTVIALPFKPWTKKTPLYPHRPTTTLMVEPQTLARRLDYHYLELDNLTQLTEAFDFILIGGARILTKEEIGERTIINSHAGYLPYARGLDALKWAIYHNYPIGVTTHIIDAEIDRGLLIKQDTIPIYPLDTFHSIANRQYELEIEMLANAVAKVKDIQLKPVREDLCDDAGLIFKAPIFQRMPADKEMVMIKRLERRLENL